MIHRRIVTTIAVAALLAAAACSHDPGRRYYDLVMKRAGVTPPSAEYALGWRNGCYSGEHDAGYVLSLSTRQDEDRYTAGGDYTRGWDDGYVYCYRRIAGLKPHRDRPAATEAPAAPSGS